MLRHKKKGSGSPIYFALSVLGILLGLFMISRGWSGQGLGATLTLVIGIFVFIKEIMDIFH